MTGEEVRRIRAESLRDAADLATAFSRDGKNKLMARAAMRSAADWLRKLAKEVEEAS